jgi:hypothetical protein
MKKILMLASLVALTGALSSCLSTGLVSFTDITFESNFTGSINNGPIQSVICDNRSTDVTYTFKVSGVEYLQKWSTKFFGESTGSSFNLPDYTLVNFAADGQLVKVTVTLNPGQAPKIRTVQPRAVVVVPSPTKIGATDIRLTIFDNQGGSVAGNLSSFRSEGKIPVINNCP